MRTMIFKIIGFLLLLIAFAKINQEAFRSEIPSLVVATIIGSVAILIVFPYKQFFNNLKQK